MPQAPGPLYQKILETLLKEFAKGKPARGEKLPSEARLAKRFGVSLITIRRVVQELQALGAVRSVHGKGSFVQHAGALTRPPPGAHVALLIDTLKGPHALERIAAVEEVVSAAGYHLLLKETRFDPAVHAACLKSLGDGVAAVLIDTWVDEYDEPGRELRSKGLPVVFISERDYGSSFEYVGYGEEQAGREALERLRADGVRDLALVLQTTAITPLSRFLAAEAARLGFPKLEVIDVAHSRAFDPGLPLIERERRAAIAVEATPQDLARSLVGERLAAGQRHACYFCINEYAAVGAYQALADGGLAAPRDVGLVGLADSGAFFLGMTRRRLTGVIKPTRSAGLKAAELLLARLGSRYAGGSRTILPHTWQAGETYGVASGEPEFSDPSITNESIQTT
ncbi:MAG: GntR family transcriptional regulator [Spirochaetes bacterium]|nr:GntR family transcriptional regulator [Spirochaetota bacterium]